MTKDDFISQLKQELKDYDAKVVDEFVADYTEHFNAGVADNRTEDEIATKLGDPKVIARELKTSELIKLAEKKPTPSNVTQVVLAFVGIGFFNLVFILGPYVGAVGILFAGFATAFALVVAGFAGTIASFAAPLIPFIELGTSPLIAFLSSISIICFGALLGIGMYYITKFFLKLTLKYIKLNLSIVKGNN